MTTLTYTTPHIMAYVGPDSGVVGKSNTTALPDWEGDYVYVPAAGAGSTAGWRKFNIDPNGEEVLQATKGAIGVPEVSFDYGGAACLSYDGSKIYFCGEAWNWDELACINTSDLTLVGTFGVAANSSTENGSSVKHVAYMVPRNASGSSVLMVAQQGGREINELTNNIGGIGYTGSLGGTKVVYGSLLGSGGAFIGNHAVYGLGLPSVTTGSIGVYAIDSSITHLGDFDPSDIDATWTQITTIMAGAYDETDGNIIIAVQTTESVTNKNYFAKISATTGAVMWVCAVNSIPSVPWALSFSRIRNQMYHFIGSSSQIYHIDTSDGSKTTETFATLGCTTQFSDDVTNSIICFSSFSDTGAAPTYVGTYATANHSWSNQWARVFWATDSSPPPPDTVVLTYTIGAVIGFTYCSHAQILRPDSGNDAGAANGPAFGKKRRTHQYTANLYRTRGWSVGLDLTKMREQPLRTAGGTTIAAPTLYSGIIDGPIEGEYDFENKIAWKVCRPYPATVLAIAGYLSTQDK